MFMTCNTLHGESVCAGIVTPLAAEFDNNRHVGESALKVLCSLVTRQHLPNEQVDAIEDLLASVRGVLRLSNMLCPVYDYSQEEPCPSLSRGTHAVKSLQSQATCADSILKLYTWSLSNITMQICFGV